jgi:hypothetical protein
MLVAQIVVAAIVVALILKFGFGAAIMLIAAPRGSAARRAARDPI